MRQLYIWLFVFFILLPSSARTASRATLEAPVEGQTLTGVGLLRGWACDAETVSVRIDKTGNRIPVLVGSPREDTRQVCGMADTGFALLLNWNNLGAGDHTLELFINGQLHTTRTVTVLTYGEPFLRGLEKTWTLPDWPEPGTDTKIAWNEATQNIEIIDIRRPEQPVNAALEALLGEWYLQSEVHGQHFFHMTHIDPDPEDPHVLGVLQYTNRGVRVYGETNTTRWFSQPLKQYEVYWIDATQCHLYAFDVYIPTGTATGYYWYGYGSDWEECFQDGHGPYTAVGSRQ